MCNGNIVIQVRGHSYFMVPVWLGFDKFIWKLWEFPGASNKLIHLIILSSRKEGGRGREREREIKRKIERNIFK